MLNYELLNKDLLEFVKEPNVEVRIKEYRPVRVSMMERLKHQVYIP